MKYTVLARGRITTRSFWPRGNADADSLKLDISDGGIYYGGFESEELDSTDIFNDAYVIDDKNKARLLITRKRIIDIRLQGVDAPELHFPVKIDKSGRSLRQNFGKTSTIKLRNELGFDRILDCDVWAYGNEPRDIFDAYGRMIGTAIVELPDDKQDDELNLNRWLLYRGWAFPTFYASMLREEIEDAIYLAGEAKKRRRGIWRYLDDQVLAEELDLEFDYSDRSYDPQDDRGYLILPKIFRRASLWAYLRKTGNLDPSCTFRDYFSGLDPDYYYYTDDFLDLGPFSQIPRYQLSDAISLDDRIAISPFDAVFLEKKSIIYDNLGNPITEFDQGNKASFPSFYGRYT